MSSSPEDLIGKLDYSVNSGFPKAALLEIISRKDQMIPFLLDVLEACRVRPEHFTNGPKAMLATYASYLLAQFRDTRGYRPIIALLSLDEKIAESLFGDSITEDMSSVIAGVFDGDEGPLRGLIENRQAGEYARASSGLRTYQSLVSTGRIDLEEVKRYFGELMEHKLEREPSQVWNNLTSISGDLGFVSLLPLIRQAFEDDLCDPWFDSLESIEARITCGASNDWPDSCEPIDDVVALMKNWACFKHPPARPPEAPNQDPLRGLAQLPLESGREFSSRPTLPPPPIFPGVTRNDPCPCGSGKKFKKCCGP